MQRQVLRELQNSVLIVAGVFAAGMGLHGFLAANSFIDGGVTGVSMLLQKVLGWPLAFVLPIVNLPFVLLAVRPVGPLFALRSCVAIALLAVVLATVHFPVLTTDRLLSAVFGGFCIGAGVGLAVRGGAVLDGTEIAALLIGRASSILRIGDVILVFNVVLFLLAIAVIGVEPSLYSILTYVSATRVLDFVLYGLDEYMSVTIISSHGTAVREQILDQLQRGVTVYSGRGGRSDEPRDVLVSVVTRLEIGRIRQIVDAIDQEAFIVVAPVADVYGGVLKRASHGAARG